MERGPRPSTRARIGQADRLEVAERERPGALLRDGFDWGAAGEVLDLLEEAVFQRLRRVVLRVSRETVPFVDDRLGPNAACLEGVDRSTLSTGLLEERRL